MLWRKTFSTKFRVLFSITLAIVLCLNWVPNFWKSPNEATIDLHQVYSRSAQYHGPERNPVIVIPGLIGSALTNLKKEPLWGQFSFTSDFTRIAMPLRPEVTNQEALKANQVLPGFKVNLFGWRFEQDVYRQILSALGTIGGYRDSIMVKSDKVDYGADHFTCFQFPYDWRQDNVKNAQHLHAFILEKREYLRQKYKENYGIEDADIKFDIVTHSMGGLLTRYFLRYGDRDLPNNGELPQVTWEGTRYVNRVILIAPPNGGSLDSFMNLVYGNSLNSPNILSEPVAALGSWAGRFGLGPANAPANVAVSGTFPSIYQMLPRGQYKPVIVAGAQGSQTIDNLFDIELWERMQWGLLSHNADSILKRLLPDVSSADERRRIARNAVAQNLKRAEQFTQALDQSAVVPEGLELQLIAGDGILTPQTIQVDETSRVKVIKTAPGDGSVIRRSALLDQRSEKNWTSKLQSPIPWKEVNFYTQDHLKLTQNSSLINNLLFTLLEKPKDIA